MQSNELSNPASKTAVVWIVNEGGHDYTTAEVFGRLMPITRMGINPFAPDRLMVIISHRLAHAKEDDHLLISGLPIVNALAIAMWLKRFKKVNLLQWSAKEKRYTPLYLTDAAVEKWALDDLKPAD